MEHNPYITMTDETEITYSDLKIRDNGEQYISIYFETPYNNGFKSMSLEYPNGEIVEIKNYLEEEVIYYLTFLREYIDLIFEDAMEEYEDRKNLNIE